MNIKKIGLTALAASLVSVSAHAGALTASGSASMNMEGHTGEQLNAGTTFSMANSVTLAGSGELDNGLTVSVSFELDQGNADGSQTANQTTSDGSVFDNHSVSVSSDTLGTLTLAGHGGNSATTAIDTTAAGDMWDNFDQLSSALTTFPDAFKAQGGVNDNLFYKSPDLTDGLNVTASYDPQAGTSGPESETGYGINYTGFEGLSLSYATTDVSGTANTEGDNDVIKASYAYGPVTVSYSNSEEDTVAAASDGETTSYAISYTLSDELSITYGSEEHSRGGTADVADAEIDGISVAYTTGGMTISAAMQDGENLDFTNDSDADVEYWSIGASFAF